MNILIIATYYPPDTTIAAVRPYMLAKYLSRLGHSVTVLRSGEIHETADRFFEPVPEVRVVSYLGENAPSELFERGELAAPRTHKRHGKIYQITARLYHKVKPLFVKEHSLEDQQENMENCLKMQKSCIDTLAENGAEFDIVFSTYSRLENAYAGEYVAKKFGCKWIMDFRDPIAQENAQSPEIYQKSKELQDYFIQKSDLFTTVAEDCEKLMREGVSDANGAVLHNGYEELSHISKEQASGVLTLCYTGQIYERQISAVITLLKAMRQLLDRGVIEKSGLQVHLAGQNAERIIKRAEKMGLKGIFIDHGYVNRQAASRLQDSADVFLLFSWNTEKEQGAITGKFYEGIRAQKPVLSIVAGTVPNGELYRMNENYHYGFCCELCKEDHFEALCDYLAQAYQQKMKEGRVCYEPSPQLALDFRYDNLAKRLSDLCQELVRENI